MKRLSESEVKKIIEEHELWLKTGGTEGKRAEFYNIDLSGMDFHGRDLREAYFALDCLKNVDFRKAKLSQTSFFGTNLKNADFRGADLTYACFNAANMDGMIYDNTTLPAIACPEKGSFIGYKKAFSIVTEDEFIVKLRIPANAKRSSGTGKKCRCNKAKVLSITKLDGTKTDVTEVCSRRDFKFIYRPGKTVKVPDFDKCRWHECTEGIHFFMDREDAVCYYC